MTRSTNIPPSPEDAAHREAAAARADEPDAFALDDPFELFSEWFALAVESEPNDPNVMTVATVDAQGRPNARCLLLKGADARGFTFFTNADSVKGAELAAAPHAALCFHWKSLRRQVRVRGPVAEVERAETDAYFATRARVSRIGARASKQSRSLSSKADLMREVERLEAEYDGQDIPCPPNWTGYRVTPTEIEFWKDGAYRLHDRLRFTRAGPDEDWRRDWLYP